MIGSWSLRILHTEGRPTNNFARNDLGHAGGLNLENVEYTRLPFFKARKKVASQAESGNC